MRIWRWLRRALWRRTWCIVITRMPVALERASIERGWSGARLVRVMGK